MARPVGLITNFGKTALPRILEHMTAGPRPPVADWYVGTYGISKGMAEQIAAAGALYAPVLPIQPRSSRQIREKRRVKKAEAALLDSDFAGRLPGTGIVPSSSPHAWGLELGRRYRDYMRRQRAAGVRVETWQFDEILAQCASSAAHRAFARGILRGLLEGRRELEDRPERGFVWCGLRPLREIPAPGASSEVAQFWEDVAAATLFFVGEEYPIFRGDPASAATAQAAGHKRLADGLERGLARKYVCGLTPGWQKPSGGLHGNVDGRPLDFVTGWRRGFIASRCAVRRPRGFGHFALIRSNLRPGERLADAVASLHFANEQLAE